jgi:hypothetical protein
MNPLQFSAVSVGWRTSKESEASNAKLTRHDLGFLKNGGEQLNATNSNLHI